MSDLQDLIHTNARVAFHQGEMRERERILSLLNELMTKQVSGGLDTFEQAAYYRALYQAKLKIEELKWT